MKSRGYWRSKGVKQIVQIEKHAEEYHEGIQDIPAYCVLLFYMIMFIITPKRAPKPKDSPKF